MASVAEFTGRAFVDLCARRLRVLLLFVLIGAVAPLAVHARSIARSAIAVSAGVVASAVEAASPPEMVLAFGPGADVDGDHAPDFANPTRHPTRVEDDFGSGAFDASRDGGSRRHRGVDYLANAGQTVAAPISGYVTKIGYAYDDDQNLRFVELSNAALGYVARVFYVDPSVEVGQTVRLGRPIGVARTLQSRYPGIGDHVHLEISRPGKGVVDPTALVPSGVFRAAIPARRGGARRG